MKKKKKKAPKNNKPHLYLDQESGKWRMTAMPGYIRGNVTGRWARGNIWVFNKNDGRRRIHRA